MWCRRRCLALVSVIWLIAGTLANPVRRAPGDLEARRRSAVDRSMIRLGRSPPEVTAADLREAFQRSTRRSNSFLRLGRSQPLILSSDDIITLLRTYNDEEASPVAKRVSNFVRLGRDPQFIRLGRTPDDEKTGNYEPPNGYPQRASRARDHFVRLGRDSQELNEPEIDEEVFEEVRRKRSLESCAECQS